MITQIKTVVIYISEQINGEDEHLVQDIDYLNCLIKSVAANIKHPEKVSILCYGASMFTIAFAEKLMRVVLAHIKKDETYIPINTATYGEMLNEENTCFVEIFGLTHLKSLSFFLTQTRDSKLGYNIRNSLAHWNALTVDQMNIQYFTRCLWLFTDILNTFFWHYWKNT